MRNIDVLTDLIARGKLQQALIFVCKQGNEDVNQVLKSLLCTQPENGKFCEKCNSCTTFDAKSNPDLSVLGAEGSIKVDDVRKIKGDGYIRPVVSDRKVFFLQNADTMTREAQNALLKIFEEPPRYLAIILQTERKDELLQTILSRATCFYFETEAPEKDDDILQKCRVLMGHTENKELYRILVFTPILSKNKEYFGRFLHHLRFLCKEALTERAGASEGDMGVHISSKTACKIYEKATQYSRNLETNASLPLLATAFLVEITE